MPLSPVLRRQRQVDLQVPIQLDLQSEFQDSQRYTKKLFLKWKKKKRAQQTMKNKHEIEKCLKLK